MSKVILVVDDSESVRKFVMFALRAKGYQVITAQDGMDALEKLATHPVDLVVTDLNMPKMDGFELLKELRLQKPLAEIPVIILSSLNNPKDKEKSFRLGASSYLVKPFNQKRIQYEVAKFLS